MIKQVPRESSPDAEARSNTPFSVEAIRALSSECRYDANSIAARLGISRRQLQRRFASSVRCPPRTWLREERLQAALRLLSQATSVKEVALSLSFGTTSQFCRDFRDRFGYTPSRGLQRAAGRSLTTARMASRR